MHPDTDTDPTHPDHERVRAVLAGSLPEWQRLVEDYLGLALTVAHRHVRDHDVARDVSAAVFESLYRGKLEQYDGRSAFSTWLVLVVRNAAVDHLRRDHGRPRLPSAILHRPPRERRAFELYFIQGWPPEAVLDRLRSEGLTLRPDELWDILGDLLTTVDERARRRMRFERAARRHGNLSGRWLEYADHRRDEMLDEHDRQRPDARLLEEEASRTIARVNAEIARLSQDERRVLDLRFNGRLSAIEIAKEMQLNSARQAFTVLERAIRKLRRALGVPLAGAPIRLEVDR